MTQPLFITLQTKFDEPGNERLESLARKEAPDMIEVFCEEKGRVAAYGYVIELESKNEERSWLIYCV